MTTSCQASLLTLRCRPASLTHGLPQACHMVLHCLLIDLLPLLLVPYWCGQNMVTPILVLSDLFILLVILFPTTCRSDS